LNLEFTEEAATFESEIEALKKEKNNQREGIEKLEADLKKVPPSPHII